MLWCRRVFKRETRLGDGRDVVYELLKDVGAFEVRIVVEENVDDDLRRLEDAFKHLDDEPALEDGASGVLQDEDDDISENQSDFVLCDSVVRRNDITKKKIYDKISSP